MESEEFLSNLFVLPDELEFCKQQKRRLRSRQISVRYSWKAVRVYHTDCVYTHGLVWPVILSKVTVTSMAARVKGSLHHGTLRFRMDSMENGISGSHSVLYSWPLLRARLET